MTPTGGGTRRWPSLVKAALFLIGGILGTSLGATQALGGEVRGLVFRDNRPLSLSTIAAGHCVQISVKVRPGVAVDPGNYAGVLAATSAGAGIARLPVTIAGPEAIPKSAAIAGAVATAELRATRNGPWGDSHLDDGGKLPLKPPKAGEQLMVGQNCKAPKSGRPDETRCPFVGNLYNGTHAAHVYLNGRPEMTKGAVLVPLRVEGADKIGDYDGSLDLAQTGKADDSLSVELKVTDAWWCALIAVVLGAALPIVLQLWSGRWRPERKLHDRRRKFKDEYAAGETGFHAFAPGFDDIHRPPDAAITNYSRTVDTAIRAYAKSSLLFDKESAAYKKIDESIALAEEDADFLGREDGLAKSLRALRSELRALATFLLERYPVGRTPQLARKAAGVLKGSNLAVGEATKRASTADGFVNVLKQWREMAEQVLRYETWARYLARLVSSDEDKKLLARAAAKLVEVRIELLDAASASDLERVGASRDLDAAYQGLIEIESRLGPVTLPADPRPAEIEIDWQALGFEESLLAAIDLPGAGHSLETWIEEAVDLTVHGARSVAIHKVWLWIADLGALFIAIVVGVVTGLSIVYFGKTFGTLEDYLTVIVVGAASQVLAKGVLDQAAVLWAAETAPPVAQDPQGAAVTTAGD